MKKEELLAAIRLSLRPAPERRAAASLLLNNDPSQAESLLENSGSLFNESEPAGSNEAESILEHCETGGYRILILGQPEYPPLLAEIPDPPLVLYTLGNFSGRPGVAVVGTRKSDPVSEQVTADIVRVLGEGGCSVVSGMALGIDRAAHCAALAHGVPTIAVLPQGIDSIHPARNTDIFRRIASTSDCMLMSEYPPGALAERWRFVRRNRIISGLCRATIVVKAAAKSGSLITARFALDQNREVFACPGTSFNESYAGCHTLINSGARLLHSATDLADILPRQHKVTPPAPDSTEHPLFAALRTGPVDADLLGRHLGLPLPQMQQLLLELEMQGAICRLGNLICLTSATPGTAPGPHEY